MPNRPLAGAIFAISLALILGVQAVELVVANPIPYPSTPNQDKPVITIENPNNNTAFKDSCVYLNFTVAKPDSWNDPQWFMPYIGQVASVKAYLDGHTANYVQCHSGFNSVQLNLSTSGLHVLNVTVLAYTYYRGPAYNGSHILSSITSTSGPVYQYSMAVSDIVYFTVEQPEQTANPQSSLPNSSYALNQTCYTIIVVAAIVVFFASLVYLKKHNSKLTWSRNVD
jgi:hypothetical protein